MQPATVHAVAQLIRHSRGLLTAVEKWTLQTRDEEELTSEIEAVGQLIAQPLLTLAAVTRQMEHVDHLDAETIARGIVVLRRMLMDMQLTLEHAPVPDRAVSATLGNHP